MQMKTFEFIGSDGVKLPAYLWVPDGDVMAVLQITHGMTEHMGRYEAFAESMCAAGIAVAGFDFRGHGKNHGNPEVASFGKGGWAASIEDIRLFYAMLHEQYPETPYYMLGFSLGSFLLREYLTKYPSKGEINGAIIMGTGHQPGVVLSIMIGVVKGQIKKAGFDQTTDLVRQLSFGTYNQKFKPNRTAADWLCADQEELEKYLADPLVRKDISAGLFGDLLGSMKRTGRTNAYDGWNTKLPILLISGQDDPVGDGGKGIMTIEKSMKKANMESVTIKLFPGARHDLLHEKKNGADEAVVYIKKWMQGNV